MSFCEPLLQQMARLFGGKRSRYFAECPVAKIAAYAPQQPNAPEQRQVLPRGVPECENGKVPEISAALDAEQVLSIVLPAILYPQLKLARLFLAVEQDRVAIHIHLKARTRCSRCKLLIRRIVRKMFFIKQAYP